MTYPIPRLPRRIVASDCFECDGQHYLVVVDLYSDLIEIKELKALSTIELIDQLKQIFAVHGVPITLISDNGPNYASKEFRLFAKTWDFQHLKSSPYHPKANEKAESAVTIMKSVIMKANKQGEDTWKAILEWRNSPTPSQGSSPAQRLRSCRTRSFLLHKSSLNKPEVQSTVAAQVVKKRQLPKCYHDAKAKPLPSLHPGQPVQVQVHPQQPRSDWKAGVTLKDVAPHSYIVEVNGRKYRRNRIHLQDALQSKQVNSPISESDQLPMSLASHLQPAFQQTDSPQTTDASISRCPNKDKGCNSRTPVQPSGSADPSKQVMCTTSGGVVKLNTLLKGSSTLQTNIA